MNLIGKNIILGVSGSIAAYKSPDIVRRLQELGAIIKVVLSEGGAKFITKMSLETTSQNEVFDNLWDSKIEHISLAKWADIILIAPASANTIADINSGKATNLLTNIILATTAQIIIVPAMNQQMLSNITTQNNLKSLTSNGFIIMQSAFGKQACGDVGMGKMPEPINIAEFVAGTIQCSKLTGKKITITLGATIEKIDPVRYLSNFSSGKMGVALANSCINMGAIVTIIYGNISVKLPTKSKNIQTLSADEMYLEVTKNIGEIFISCAAVSDFKPVIYTNKKIKKSDNINLKLIKNIDILKTISNDYKKLFCVGFAAETNNLIEYAQNKLINKKLDMIVANNISCGFGTDENEVIVINKNTQIKLTKKSKNKIATEIMQIIAKKFII